MLLSILIPAYEEEATIREVLRLVSEVDTESMGFDKQIIVCDDASADRTAAIAARVAQSDDRVTVLRHETNRGKGAAIRTALNVARGEYCLIQDADLEYDVDDYPALLHAVNDGARVVYGSRFLRRRHPEGMRLPNFLANRILAISANIMFGLSITDEATCFKVIETDLLRSLNLECERFEFCPEVTAKIGKRGVAITEVPIDYHARSLESGKKIRWTDGVEALWVLIKHRLRRD